MYSKAVQEKAEAVNTYYENHDSETRLWQTDNGMWFICYNALSDQDEIYETSEAQIDRLYAELVG